MLHRHSYRETVWIDSEQATEEEAKSLGREFALPDAVVSEITAKNFKPVCRTFPDHLYLTLHFPALKHTHSESRKQEIDFILGRTHLITNHYDTVDPIHKFAKSFEVETVTRPDGSALNDVADTFLALLKKLYRSVMHELEYQSDELFEIETTLFDGQEREMVTRLSKESVNLLIIEQVLMSHKEVLADLEGKLERFWGEGARQKFQAVRDEYERVTEKTKLNRGLLNELRHTNDTILQTKQNEVMKIFTILAFVTFPLTLLTSVFGMNTEHMPLQSSENGFWYIVLGMILTTIVFVLYFRYKKWL